MEWNETRSIFATVIYMPLTADAVAKEVLQVSARI